MKLIEEIVPVTFGFRTSEPVPGLSHAYVYKSDKGEMVAVKTGELMTNKKGKAHKFNVRYRVKTEQESEVILVRAASKEEVYEFVVKLTLNYSVGDPVTYILANQDPFINELTDNLKRETKNFARQYSMNEISHFEYKLTDYLYKSNDLYKLGVNITINAEVEQDSDYRMRIKGDHELDVNKERVLKEMENEREIKERALESIRKLLVNSRFIGILEFEDDPKQIKKILLKEYMDYMKDYQEEVKQLKSSLINGKIDSIEFKTINESLKEAMEETDIVVIKRDLEKLDFQAERPAVHEEVVIDFREEEDFLEENEVR